MDRVIPNSLDLASATGVLVETKGGTNNSTYTTGDILYASATNTLSKLAAGTNGDVLTLVAGVPVWAAAAAAAGAFWAKITNSATISITAATTATINRLHIVSGTSANYDITMPSSPAAGDVVGFIVREFAAADKVYRLDATGSVVIAGRTRYLSLIHTNVALFYYDGTRWLSLVCELDTPLVDGGAMTVTATTTNPTKGTVELDKIYWSRRGGILDADYRLQLTAAGTDGSGTYLYALPIGSTSSFQPLIDNLTGNSATTVATLAASDCGGASVSTNTTPGHGRAHMKTATTFCLSIDLNGGTFYMQGSAAVGFGNTATRIAVKISVPIADW